MSSTAAALRRGRGHNQNSNTAVHLHVAPNLPKQGLHVKVANRSKHSSYRTAHHPLYHEVLAASRKADQEKPRNDRRRRRRRKRVRGPTKRQANFYAGVRTTPWTIPPPRAQVQNELQTKRWTSGGTVHQAQARPKARSVLARQTNAPMKCAQLRDLPRKLCMPMHIRNRGGGGGGGRTPGGGGLKGK